MFLLRKWLGEQGVHDEESEMAKAVSKGFFILTLPLILLFAMDLSRVSLFGRGYITTFFGLQIVVMGLLVKDRLRYYKTNWAPIVVVAVGTYVLFNPIEHSTLQVWLLILIVGLLLPWLDLCIRSLAQGQVTGVLLMVLMMIALFGIFATNLEPDYFPTLSDGLWWAFSTASLLGDAPVPKTVPGRIMSAFVVLGGLTLFSVFVANLTSYLNWHKKKNRVEKQQAKLKTVYLLNKQILAELKELRSKLGGKSS